MTIFCMNCQKEVESVGTSAYFTCACDQKLLNPRQAIAVHFRTNLDISKLERWPRYVPARPMVGDLVQSQHYWKHPGRCLELEVTRVKLLNDGSYDAELHIIESRHGTAGGFESWYENFTGQVQC